jgi:hypothetical protein
VQNTLALTLLATLAALPLSALTTLLAALSRLLLLLTWLLWATALLAALATLTALPAALVLLSTLATLILLARFLFVGVHICYFHSLPIVTTSALRRSSFKPYFKTESACHAKPGADVTLTRDLDPRRGRVQVVG